MKIITDRPAWKGSFFKPDPTPKKSPQQLSRGKKNKSATRVNPGEISLSGFIPNSSLKQKRRKPTGEKAVFDEIWDERPHKCELTGEPIRNPTVKNFMHGWSKGCVKKYRLDKRNIFIVADWIHDEYDNRGRTNPIFAPVREMVALLKLEYHGK